MIPSLILLTSLLGVTTGLQVSSCDPGERCVPAAHCHTTGKAGQLRRCGEQGVCCHPGDSKVWGYQGVEEVQYGGHQQSAEGVCGVVRNEKEELFDLRVVGGTTTKAGEWPWAAKLIYKDPLTVCGGTLVSRRHVVTAAHCVQGKVERPVEVVLGQVTVGEERGVRRRLRRMTVHPRFTDHGRSLLEYDLAVLELAEDVTFSEYVRPVCLSSTSSRLGEELVVTGWGNTTPGLPGVEPKTADILQSVMVRRVGVGLCKQYLGLALSPLNHLCVETGVAGEGPCQGDSGGGVVGRMRGGAWSLVGVVSQSRGVCGALAPLVVTRVEGGLGEWVREVIEGWRVHRVW